MRQQRLLVSPLSRPWQGLAHDRCWAVYSGVGFFYRTRPREGYAPDVMLSLDVKADGSPGSPPARPYLAWETGKPPEVVVSLVSEVEAHRLECELRYYALGGVRYCAAFDPSRRLDGDVLQAFRLDPDTRQYVRLDRPWFPGVMLGLAVWGGTFEGERSTWLRWCDEKGDLLPVGDEALHESRRGLSE